MIYIFNLVLIALIVFYLKKINLMIKNHKHQQMVSNMIDELSFKIDIGCITINDAARELDFLEMLSKMKLK